MGAIYCVLPLDEKVAAWLNSEGIPYSIEGQPRAPRSNELREVLSQLENFTVTFGPKNEVEDWSAQIESSIPGNPAWSRLYAHDSGSDDGPCDFSFSKGYVEVVFAVVKELVRRCGTMVVFDDSSVWPVAVSESDSLADLVERFNNSWPDDAHE